MILIYETSTTLTSKNIEHRTSNVQRRTSKEESLRSIFFKIDRIHYSMLDVQCSMFDVNQFLSRFDWEFAASGSAFI